MKTLTSILITFVIVVSLLLTGYFMMTNLLNEIRYSYTVQIDV